MTTATRESTQDPQLEEVAEDLAIRITRIDARLDAMTESMATKADLADRFGELNSRINGVEKRMEVGFAELRGEMDRRFAEMDRRFAEQDAKIADASRRQIVWTVGTMFAFGTLVVTAMAVMG